MSLNALRFRVRRRRGSWRACRSKVRYPTFHDAERARLDCERVRGQRLRVYDCVCRGFHLTSRALRR